jgi:hypothetical protein
MARHAESLTIELLPEADDLRLDDLLEELEALKGALRETERLVTGQEPSLFFRVLHLQKNSPAVIELQAVSNAIDERAEPRFASYVVRNLTANLRVIGNRKRLPGRIDVPTLDAYLEMTEPLERHGLEVVIRSGPNSVRLDRTFRKAIETVMGEDEISYGSVTGRIEGMNTHSRRSFRLYPAIGPYRVLGFFKKRDREKFSRGMDKYVTVWGMVKYKTWDKFPYAIDADDIEVHEGPYTPFSELKGIAPHATGPLSSVEYLDNLRDD